VLACLFKWQNKEFIQNWTEPSLQTKSNVNEVNGSFVQAVYDPSNFTLSMDEHVDHNGTEEDAFPITTTNTSSDEYNNSDNRKLDFAIIGFGKCGTSFLMKNVLNIPQINFGNEPGKLPHESKFMRDRDVEGIYRMFESSENTTVLPGQRVLNGLKEPNILVKNGSLQFFKKHFKATKLIVTLRHPVWRFQSAYNFFILRRFDFGNESGEGPPLPHDFIGDCGYYCNENCVAQNQKAMCTSEFNIHHFLSRLKWTSMNTIEETSLLGHEEMENKRLSNDMFLMDLEQMSDKDQVRRQGFERDLEAFMGLKHDAITIGNHSRQKRDTDLFDICDSAYQDLRQELVIIGANASKWISAYFVQSPHVTVANRDHFIEVIKKWGQDPCEGMNHM
jgi:hypothetical protein